VKGCSSPRSMSPTSVGSSAVMSDYYKKTKRSAVISPDQELLKDHQCLVNNAKGDAKCSLCFQKVIHKLNAHNSIANKSIEKIQIKVKKEDEEIMSMDEGVRVETPRFMQVGKYKDLMFKFISKRKLNKSHISFSAWTWGVLQFEIKSLQSCSELVNI